MTFDLMLWMWCEFSVSWVNLGRIIRLLETGEKHQNNIETCAFPEVEKNSIARKLFLAYLEKILCGCTKYLENSIVTGLDAKIEKHLPKQFQYITRGNFYRTPAPKQNIENKKKTHVGLLCLTSWF